MTPAVAVAGITLRYGKKLALDQVTLELPGGGIAGLIGPDGAGKSSLLSLIAGARRIQHGTVRVLGGDMASARHRRAVCPRIAYMPQGLGKNLYPTLSVEENLQFFGRLFGHDAASRRHRIDALAGSTGLSPFMARAVGDLSGGMKQKLGLCCALIHDPDLLILDEPTTGVDPLARAQFWDLIAGIRQRRPGMSVLVATAYFDEASRYDLLFAMDGGRILAQGPPAALLAQNHSATLGDAFLALLPESRRNEHRSVNIPPFIGGDHTEPPAIEAEALTRRFGGFTAVDGVNLRIARGEIFGFIGSNGCGKSTTMKMLTGLLPATSGSASLLGKSVDASDLATRSKVGYLSQSFSLYGELTVRQNLVLHARLFALPEITVTERVTEMIRRFDLVGVAEALPESLPLGIRQRLSLAVAMVHGPELLILDEPTSGVDPVARDRLWQLMIDLARNDRVTIFISTHFMEEAGRCDRIALMHAGRILVTGVPAQIAHERGAPDLEQAFIGLLTAADPQAAAEAKRHAGEVGIAADAGVVPRRNAWFSVGRAWAYSRRESLELLHDPVRATMALAGSLLLMFVFSFGINLDVQPLAFAVLDRDDTALSRDYQLNLAGSRYFTARSPITDTQSMDQRLRSGELALAIEIPAGFARDVARGGSEIAGWVDGSMPNRAENVLGYVQGMHQSWLAGRPGQHDDALPARIEPRFRYNPEVKSLPAIVPGVIPMLLLIIPAMLAALSVVREKELGSILNLYVTPVTRSEFLLGKQLPYVALAMLNFALMTLLAVTVLGVPLHGSLVALTLGALVFTTFATGFGLFASAFTRSQVAAMFSTMLFTIIPAVQFAGMINPVSSLTGVGAIIGNVYPASYFFSISRGVFNKGLGFSSQAALFWPLLASVPVVLGLAILLLRKQER